VLSLDFDTGSSDLWVFSSETPWGSVNGQATYNPFLSNTSTKIPNAKWSISYGDGSASSGDVYTDKVTVGGLTVSKQAVEAAQTVSASFTSDSNNDGLLGLAFSSINTVTPNRQKTFFDNAKAALDAPLFTADLKHGVAGSYNFGFIDQAAYTGDITYTPVDSSQGFWKFSASGYSIGTGNFSSTEISGIADTGTTLLLLPASIVKAYYAKVSGARYDSNQAGYVFSCAATLPDFTFGVGNAKITIPGSYINFAPVDGSDGTDTQCYGGIQEDTGIGFAVYGDIALKAAFVVFDGGNTTRLGWASKAL
jgi:aspergillopepsin I